MRLLLSRALLAPAAAERFGPPSVWEKFEHRSFVSAKSRHFQGGAGSGAVTYFYQNATLDHFGEPEPAACLNEQCEWRSAFTSTPRTWKRALLRCCYNSATTATTITN